MDLFQSQETNRIRFLTFHLKHPRVYTLYDRFAKELISQGHKKLGSKMIIERIRWEYWTGSHDEYNFKINNDFTAWYAREFIKHNPQYAEYFELREIKKF